jgi:phage baseplate assembly protein W
MAEFDFRDFYIGYEGHPRFTINRIITDDAVRVIIQKYEMLIFTNKGEVMGDPDFGCDLEKLLHETSISAEATQNLINEQIIKYIPEIINIDYTLEVTFEEDPENYQDVMIINFAIGENEINAVIS